MKLRDFTFPSCLFPQLACSDHAAAVGRLVQALAAAGQVRRSELLVAEILRREQETSTAIGGGLSIPHANSPEVSRLVLSAATLAKPLAMPSADGRPVDVMILIAGPARDPRLMLKVLARLARLVRHSSFLDRLRGAETAAEMWDILAAEPGSGAA